MSRRDDRAKTIGPDERMRHFPGKSGIALPALLRSPRNKRGFALLLALVTVSFLVILTVQLSSQVNWQLEAARNQGDSLRLDYDMLSGLNLFRAALYRDAEENTYDSLQDLWATLDEEKIKELLPDSEISLSVTDLSGLLQVNALVPENKDPQKQKEMQQLERTIWLRFLSFDEVGIKDMNDREALVDALSDWIDKDDEEREKGAESSYYQSLEKPYKCANAPFRYPEELLLVKGMTKEILYGDKEHLGIIKYLTIAGRDGKININSAPDKVLQSLGDAISEDDIQKLVEFRSEKENRESLEQPDWYRRVAGFPGDVEFPMDLLTTGSFYFALDLTARHNGLEKSASGIVHRDKDRRQALLYWKIE